MKTNELTQEISMLKSTSCYNPYLFNGYVVDRIYFYDNITKEVIFSVNWWGNNNEHKTLFFNFSIKKANKIDLSRNTAFFVSGEANKYEKRINIYIPSCLVPVSFLGEKLRSENENEKTYMSDYSITAYCSKTPYKLDENKQIVYFELPIEERQLIYSTNWRRELKPMGELKHKMSELAKSVNMDLSVYDFDKLMTIFDIKIK